jgi:hypothetical protein
MSEARLPMLSHFRCEEGFLHGLGLAVDPLNAPDDGVQRIIRNLDRSAHGLLLINATPQKPAIRRVPRLSTKSQPGMNPAGLWVRLAGAQARWKTPQQQSETARKTAETR